MLTIGLGVAWFVVDGLRNARVTLFQPFRMATVARGLALAAIAGRVVELWLRGGLSNRSRASLLCLAWTGDLAAIVATAFESAAAFADKANRPWAHWLSRVVLAFGLFWLARNDTASGYVPLSLALGFALIAERLNKFTIQNPFSWKWNRRLVFVLCLAWIMPAAGAVATILLNINYIHPVYIALATRWRFGETPKDDIERLAVWCRSNTEPTARFMTPPGPKTFRLWSDRAVAFNRASSPYHAAGLADWADRFRDHVFFDGSLAEFARAYLTDRHALERRFDDQSDRALAALAIRQRASYLISDRLDRREALELLHVEGRYAVYRVHRDRIAADSRFPRRSIVR